MKYIYTTLVATLMFTGTSFAATINVPGDQPTIQGAINASVNGDVIAIAAGTYYESNLNPNGKAITIGSASGNLDVTIDAQQGGSVFKMTSGEGEGTVINDLVITGGSASYGGGIYCFDNSNPTISNCTIEGNTANYGGGIFSNACNPTISNCTIMDNTASYAGGIFSYQGSNPTISDSSICGNEPDQIDGSYTASESCIEESCDLCVADSDADGVPDYLDQCPGEDDTIDTDSDGTADCIDGCPEDPLKTEPGDCGCGELETDTDSDGTADCIDGCPEDPLKTEPGDCGCGIEDSNVFGDLNCDGVYDIDDIYAGMAHFGIDNGPTGACCVTSGCAVMAEAMCTDLGGTWTEVGSCDDCVAPPETCDADLDGDGEVKVADLLLLIGAWGVCP
jgi:hypothetical protein